MVNLMDFDIIVGEFKLLSIYCVPRLAIPTYRSLLSAGPQGYAQYPPRSAVCRFGLVALLLHGHGKGSIAVHYL